MTDLRLAIPAVVAWATALACTQVRAVPLWVPVAVAVVALLLGGALFVPRARQGASGGVVATLAVCAALACAVMAATVASTPERRPAALERIVAEGGVVAVGLELEERPTPLPGPGGRVVADVTIRDVSTSEARTEGLSTPAVLFVEAPPRTAGAGSTGRLTVRVDEGRAGERAAFVVRAVGEARWRAAEHGPDPAGTLRERFAELARDLPGDGGRLLPGLAVGDTSLVGEALDARMTTASLSHLTAVSGANCAIVVGAVFGLLALLAAPRWLRVASALVALAGFVVLVTPEPSVIRAATMATIVLVALAVGRPSAGVPVLGLAVVLVLMGDPWLSRSFGLALSAAATAGLLLLAGPLSRALERVLPSPIALALALPLAAQLACQPVIVLLDPSVPVWAVPANMLAAPAAPIATVLGMVACLVLPVVPVLATGVAALAWLPAQWIAGVAAAVDAAPIDRLPGPPGAAGVVAWLVVLGGVALLVGARIPSVRRAAAIVLVVGVGGHLAVVGGTRLGEVWSRPPDWTVAMCDVGQGDAVLVRDGDAVALVDTGPEPAALEDCLADLGVDRIELLVLTHFDLDHVGGVAAVIGRTTEVLHQPLTDPADASVLTDLEAGGARLSPTTAGRTGALGRIPWEALWPPPDEPRWTGNDGSVVIEFGGGVDAILLGDLGADSELALLADGRVGRDYAIVKVAHHGSADQYPALYERIHARLALVSAGADNDYGHPTRTALALLEQAGTAVARTDLAGTTLVTVRDGALSTWSAGPAPSPG